MNSIIGQQLQIKSLKHDQSIHRIWCENYLLEATDEYMIIGNEATKVIEASGRKFVTQQPAIGYFFRNHWFNIIGLLEGEHVTYYCNLSSPYRYDPDTKTLSYIDYDLDVIVDSDFTYQLHDEKEYELNRFKYHYSKEVQEELRKNFHFLLQFIKKRAEPFQPHIIQRWYEIFLTYT